MWYCTLAALMMSWTMAVVAARADTSGILRAAAGLADATGTEALAHDADGDGVLTIVDAVIQQRALIDRRAGRVTRTPANRYGANGIYYGVVVDDPLLNANPDAHLVATHQFINAFNSTLGVWYHHALGRWVIFNEDRSPMANGEVFHYVFGEDVRAFTASGEFRTFVEGYDIAATLIATHCFTAGYNPSPLGVGADNPPRWYTYNEDYSEQTGGETLFVANAAARGGVAFHGTSNSFSGYGLYLDDERLNGRPHAIVLVGHAYYRAPNPSPMGVWYDEVEERWVAFNENGAYLPMGEAVNYMVWSP